MHHGPGHTAARTFLMKQKLGEAKALAYIKKIRRQQEQNKWGCYQPADKKKQKYSFHLLKVLFHNLRLWVSGLR